MLRVRKLLLSYSPHLFFLRFWNQLIDLGLTEYQRALDIQKTLVKKRLDDSVTDTLLLLEHPHVITLGRQTKPGDVLDNSIPIVEIDRGGSATYHGPGQLIGYVIIDLRRKGISVPTLITKIHESLIRTLSELDITFHKDLTNSVVVPDNYTLIFEIEQS